MGLYFRREHVEPLNEHRAHNVTRRLLLVVQLEHSVQCVCVSVCPDNDFRTKRPLTQIFGVPFQLDAI